MNPFLSVAGKAADSAMLHMPWRGVWCCDLDLGTDFVPSGRVEVRLGDWVLSGTVDPERSGAYRSGARVRVWGGAGGWDRNAPKRHFHGDQGVKRRTVLADTARAVGETLELDAALDVPLGEVDFMREEAPASTVFERAGSPLWWVAADGVTHVAPARPTPASGPLQLLDWDPRLRTATLGDVAPIEVGSQLTIDGVVHVVRELRVHVAKKAARTVVVLADVVANRLYDGIAAIARQVDLERLLGLFRYRVFEMSADRVELQVVKRLVGLPDAIPLSIWPGVAGCWAKLQPGALVLVQFIEGDVSLPIVTHAEPKAGAGFVPLELLLDATETVRLGPSAAAVELAGPGGKAVHRVDDFGEAGTLTGSGALSYTGPNGGSGSITAIADLTTGTVTFAGSASLTTKAGTGSAKVTAE